MWRFTANVKVRAANAKTCQANQRSCTVMATRVRAIKSRPVEALEAECDAIYAEARSGGWCRSLAECKPPVAPSAYLSALVARGDEHEWGCAHARAVSKRECPTCKSSTRELHDAWVAEAEAVAVSVRSMAVTIDDAVLRPSTIEFRLSVSGGDADVPLSIGSMMASLRPHEDSTQHEVGRGTYAHAWWDVAAWWPPSVCTVFELPSKLDGGATVAEPGDMLDISLRLEALSEREQEAAKLLGINIVGKVSGVPLNEWHVDATVRLPAHSSARVAASADVRHVAKPKRVWGHAEILDALCFLDGHMSASGT